MKRTAVFAGSFDPITVGHADIIKRAALLFDELHVIICVNPDKRYMFSEKKRLDMLRAAVSEIDHDGNITCGVWDGPVFEYCRRAGSGIIVKGVRGPEDFNYEKALAAQTKMLCPSVDTVLLPVSCGLEHISSSYAREIIRHGYDPSGVVPPGAAALL